MFHYSPFSAELFYSSKTGRTTLLTQSLLITFPSFSTYQIQHNLQYKSSLVYCRKISRMLAWSSSTNSKYLITTGKCCYLYFLQIQNIWILQVNTVICISYTSILYSYFTYCFHMNVLSPRLCNFLRADKSNCFIFGFGTVICLYGVKQQQNIRLTMRVGKLGWQRIFKVNWYNLNHLG